jgi:dGTPase
MIGNRSLPESALRGGAPWRAPYAADPRSSRGRPHPEPEDRLRSAFESDRDRIVHSNAFRRLKDKTQVFVHHEGDHFRTRLSHSLEVAQVARAIARPLGLDEDLAEALALAHDLGHPPFGHAGERALDRALASFGGFDHNVQSLRIVTRLERRYPLFDGLNLTWETLEGLVKRDVRAAADHAPMPAPGGPASDPAGEGGQRAFDVHTFGYASAEAQVAALADDIAYAAHDLEDGLRAGLIAPRDLAGDALVGGVLRDVDTAFPGLEPALAIYELTRRLTGAMIEDVIAETAARLEAIGARRTDDVRASAMPVVSFGPVMAEAHSGLKAFLFRNLYRSGPVMERVRLAEGIIADLFRTFMDDPDRLPAPWRAGTDRAHAQMTARRIADYLAGMTDRYAISEHRRLFDATPDLG